MPRGIYVRTERHKRISVENLEKAIHKGVYPRTKKMRENISKATIQQWKDGKHSGDSERMKRRWASDPSFREAISKGVSKRLKRDWKDPKYREKMMKALRSGQKISSPQRLMFRWIKSVFASAKMEFFSRTSGLPCHIDIAIPDRRIAIEVDGRYWHSRPGVKEKDQERNFNLWDTGWRVYRIEAEEVKKYGLELLSELVFEEIESLEEEDLITLDCIMDYLPLSSKKEYAVH